MVHISLRRPILGGIVFAIVFVILSLAFFNITGILAREILETSMSGIISLCYVISIGSIYILVIILHLLSARLPRELTSRHKHYRSLLQIAKLATLIIIFSIIVILFLNIPFTRIDFIPVAMYSKIYYVVLVTGAVLGGSFISIIAMIYLTIRNMINQKDIQLSLNLNDVEPRKASSGSKIRSGEDVIGKEVVPDNSIKEHIPDTP